MKVSEKVLRVMEGEHISAEELAQMVERAALLRESGFNRRFHHWYFRVEGESLVDMRYENLVEVGRGDTSMYEEHETCQGAGCRACGWAGEIIRRVSDRSLKREQPLGI